MNAANLVTTGEIATWLGISRGRVDKISRTHTDFPQPLRVVGCIRVWRARDVEAWAAAHHRIRTPA